MSFWILPSYMRPRASCPFSISGLRVLIYKPGDWIVAFKITISPPKLSVLNVLNTLMAKKHLFLNDTCLERLLFPDL